MKPIRRDDEINRYGETGNVTYQDQAWFEQQIESVKAQYPNASVEKIGNKYVIKANVDFEGLLGILTMEIREYPEGYVLVNSILDSQETLQTNSMEELGQFLLSDEILAIAIETTGLECNKDASSCSVGMSLNVEGSVITISYVHTKNEDGSYSANKNTKVVVVAGSTPNTLVISGDETGRVELNNAINGFRGVEVFDTNVFFGEKALVNYALDVFSGSVNGAIIENNGIMNVSAGAIANDTVVNLGGLLKAEAQAKLNNLLANAGSKLELDTDTILQGEVVIHKDADVSGSTYDFGKIFSNTNLEVNSLTVVGGINDVFVEDDVSKLVNEDLSKDKGLTLEGGEYSLANVIKEGSTQVAGWDVINIKASESAPATIVKLESDIELVGSNKKINLGENAVLDVSGHSPLEITIDGSLENSGLVNFWHETDDADDKVTIKGNYNAKSGAQVLIDINPDINKADKIVVEGDVSGTTEVIGEATSDAKPSEKILFVEAPNDNPDTGASFKVSYVNGSVYKWNTIYDNNAWYIGTSDIVPDGSVNGYEGVQGDAGNNGGLTDKPLLRPEMIAYMGLYDAGFEQTASLNRVIAENVGKNQLLGKGCRGTLCREINPVRNAWVAPVHQNLDIDAPYKYEAKISGIDAGIDINSDGINKWGVLASYRKGNYEFDGSGDKYYSDEGSEIDIDSYVMGLYFRRDKYNTKVAGTIYAGMQEAEISSDDGAKAKTDALEVGASLDVSHIFEVAKDITIAPELQISYQMLDYDNIKDNAGKKVQLEAAHRITAEAGAKLEKKWTLDEGKAAIYVKPSVIQTIHGGGKLNVKGLDSIHTTEDRTLGRFEIGAEYEVNTRWSVGASTAHTFGSDYKDTTFSLDAKYRF